MLEITTLTIFFYIVALPVLLRNIFHDTYIWQIKEYRIDRIISHLRYKEEPSGRNRTINILQYVLLVATFIFIVRPNNYLLFIPAATFGTYVYESLLTLESFKLKRLFLPKKSIRNLLISSLSLFVMLGTLLIPLNFTNSIYKDSTQNKEKIEIETITLEDFLIQENTETQSRGIPLAIMIVMIVSFIILIQDLTSPIIVSVFALTTEPLATLKRNRTIRKSKKIIKQNPKLKVVAITGSYGKTTTKEILYAIIKDNFKTAKTDENFNSSVGIAESVIKNLEKDTEVFVAEMGAYKKGEITKSTSILKPDISIVTAVSQQHLSLFGSMQNLFDAKYEIIANLKQNGTAILNGNNQYCLKMAEKTDHNTILFYSVDKETSSINLIPKTTENEKPEPGKSVLFALNIEEQYPKIKFDLKYLNQVYPIELELEGREFLNNILASIAASLELKMELKDIVAKLQTMQLPKIHLKTYDGINGSKIIDDGYNSNPEGFLAAIDLLTKQQGKKIIITKGLIELGPAKSEINERIAIAMTQIDVIISSDAELIDMINLHSNKTKTLKVNTKEDFLKTIHQNINKNDNVLIEGALHPEVIKTLIEENDE